MKKIVGSTHVIVVILLVVVLLGFLGFTLWQNFSSQPTTVSDDSSKPTAKDKVGTIEKTGVIKGEAVYPSDGYPADFRVCVLDASTKAEIACDSSMAGKAVPKLTYQISVTPGTYLIAAQTNNMTGYYDGYMQGDNRYTEGLDLCDAKYNRPIVISVANNQTISDIDAGDFIYNPESCNN